MKVNSELTQAVDDDLKVVRFRQKLMKFSEIPLKFFNTQADEENTLRWWVVKVDYELTQVFLKTTWGVNSRGSQRITTRSLVMRHALVQRVQGSGLGSVPLLSQLPQLLFVLLDLVVEIHVNSQHAPGTGECQCDYL